MHEPFVRFDGVWKKFRRGEMHDSLRDLIPAVTRRLVGRAPRRGELDQGDFWALRDVSFEVAPGDVLGIIGPNGAGKSTALKILTRIHRPDRGVSMVRGRIGALIEIAAGFHPDLTGAENIYLQGSIMGMHTEEITDRFDRIVEFAGIPDFIDTQIKRYSSGMNARLGFAIAAHLDPDVLIIDEVLAVGDFAFQTKAFDRMQEVASRDIPVLVVSHQLDRIAALCTKALLLDRGKVVAHGEPGEVIGMYLAGAATGEALAGAAPITLDFTRVETAQPVESGAAVKFRIAGQALMDEAHKNLCAGFRLRRSDTGLVVYATDTRRSEVQLPPAGRFTLDIEFFANLAPGVYLLEPWVFNHQEHREVGVGPRSYLQVHGGPGMGGIAQCNASFRVQTDDARPDAGQAR